MGEFVLSYGDHILFLIIGLIVPFFAIMSGKPDMSEFTFTSKQKIALYYSNGLLMWLATFFIISIWVYNDRSLSDFGFCFPYYSTLGFIALAIFVVGYILDLGLETLIPSRKAKTKEKLKENTPFLPANFNELGHFTFAAFTAGVCEEIIFRGFFMNYILAFTGDNMVGFISAFILPALLFSVVHIYQGHKAVLKILFAGLLFGLIYYYTKSLLIVIALHFIMDMLSAYVGMRLINE